MKFYNLRASDGSGEPADLCDLARFFPVYTQKLYMTTMMLIVKTTNSSTDSCCTCAFIQGLNGEQKGHRQLNHQVQVIANKTLFNE